MKSANGVQSPKILLLIILIVLVVIVASISLIIPLFMHNKSVSSVEQTINAVPAIPATTTPSPQPTPPSIPPAIPAGEPLYSTLDPFFGCDQQVGHWTSTANASVTCNSAGSEMVNTSGRPAIANLDRLGRMPSPSWPRQNFIVQVQVSINPSSHGTFGIDFPLHTGDSSPGYHAYLLDQFGHWTFDHYDTQGNLIDTLVSGSLPASMSTTFIIDIRVQQANYTFYINGINNGEQAVTNGIPFANKIVGLVVEANADVTFSKFALYALP